MKELHIFTFGPFSENTYLLDHGDGNATVFDPGMSNADERNAFMEFLESKGLTLVNCLLTHAHLDHVMGAQWIFNQFNLLPRLHPADSPTWEQSPISAQLYGIPMDSLPERGKDLPGTGATIELGKFTLEVREAPGHCLGHVVFVCHEHEFVIGGDVLFKGSIGRTDLPGGDFKILISSIKNQLFSLPDAYIVYPGHGEYTTIGREKKSNIHFMNDNFLNRN